MGGSSWRRGGGFSGGARGRARPWTHRWREAGLGAGIVTLRRPLFLSVGAAEAALDFPTDMCQASLHSLTPGASVRAHLYNSMWAFHPGNQKSFRRGVEGEVAVVASRQLGGDDIALGAPRAEVPSQLGRLFIDLGQVTYLSELGFPHHVQWLWWGFYR